MPCKKNFQNKKSAFLWIPSTARNYQFPSTLLFFIGHNLHFYCFFFSSITAASYWNWILVCNDQYYPIFFASNWELLAHENADCRHVDMFCLKEYDLPRGSNPQLSSLKSNTVIDRLCGWVCPEKKLHEKQKQKKMTKELNTY